MSEVATSVSVIIPVYCGEKYLRRLVEEIRLVRERWLESGAPLVLAEAIFVDDSALDGSPALIDALAAEHPWIVPLHMMRNFGQHPATIAGVLHSSGDWVVTIDEDMQHPPASIEALLRHAVRQQADIVYAKPNHAVHEAKSRDWTSRTFKGLMSALIGNKHVRDFNSFRLIRGPLARAASSVCGYETYFDIALSWYTKRVSVLPLTLKDERFIESGKSGYTFRKLLTHARRLLISSQVKIVRMFGVVGLMVVLMSIVGFIWIIGAKTLAPDTYAPSGWASIMVLILFFGGFITLMLAVMLEYLSTLVLAANGKPIFFTFDRSADKVLIAHFGGSPN